MMMMVMMLMMVMMKKEGGEGGGEERRRGGGGEELTLKSSNPNLTGGELYKHIKKSEKCSKTYKERKKKTTKNL